jgi:hypothetical protein
MSLTAGRLALVAALCAAAACVSEPDPPATSSLTVRGVVTHDGAPLAQTTVDAELWDTAAGQALVTGAVSSDAAGRFEVHLELDTLLVGTYYFASVALPPFGSGLRAVFADGHATFDEAGRADTELAFAIERVAPPVADGPGALLDPARLVGRYDGRSVDPVTFTDGGANLTVEIDSISAARPFGHFVIGFDSSTGCDNGGGENLIDGELDADTLHLRLLAGVSREQDFEVTSPDALNDTLIVRYPPGGGGDCSWGFPAPIRLVRQVGP